MLDGHDLIVIGRQNAVGKSTAIPIVREAVQKQGFSCSEVPFPVYRTLLQLTQEDEGGYHHFHEWQKSNASRLQGHEHTNGEQTPDEPFTVIGNRLPDELFRRQYQTLVELPRRNNHLWVVDLVGGVNTHPKDSILSLVDYSFQRKSDLLRAGLLPNEWLSRVQAALHIRMDENTRSVLLDERTKDAYARAEAGKVAFLKPDAVKGFYGKDDFFALAEVLVETGLSPVNIRSLENDGTPRYFERLRETVKELYPRTGGRETPFTPKGASKER